MAKKKQEERYYLTFKGLLSFYVSEPLLSQIWDGIELHCYRTETNAVLITQPGGEFIEVRNRSEENQNE